MLTKTINWFKEYWRLMTEPDEEPIVRYREPCPPVEIPRRDTNRGAKLVPLRPKGPDLALEAFMEVNGLTMPDRSCGTYEHAVNLYKRGAVSRSEFETD